jgi:hypothetical protein
MIIRLVSAQWQQKASAQESNNQMAARQLGYRSGQKKNCGSAIDDRAGQKKNRGMAILELRQPKEKSQHGNLGIVLANRKVAARQSWDCAGQKKNRHAATLELRRPKKSCCVAILRMRRPKKNLRRGNLGIAPTS